MARSSPKKKTRKRHPATSRAYGPTMCERAKAITRLGATREELAECLGVCFSTIRDWQRKHPEFQEALEAGRVEPDAHVERSLYQRATGYSHDDEEIFVHEGQVIRVPVRKHYPPETKACIFWLQNRRGDRWKDMRTHHLTARVQHEYPEDQLIATLDGIIDRAKLAAASADDESAPLALPDGSVVVSLNGQGHSKDAHGECRVPQGHPPSNGRK